MNVTINTDCTTESNPAWYTAFLSIYVGWCVLCISFALVPAPLSAATGISNAALSVHDLPNGLEAADDKEHHTVVTLIFAILKLKAMCGRGIVFYLTSKYIYPRTCSDHLAA